MSDPSSTLLDSSESATLAQLETRIESGLSKFLEVGEALSAIRDAKLYRATHATFEDYCRERWNMTRRRAYQFIEAAEVVGTIVHKSAITTESQARELAKVEPKERAGVIKRVQEKTDGKVTAKAIREEVTPPAPAVTTDTARLAEWVKAHAAGMPVAEIARSYKVTEDDVRGALQLPSETPPPAPPVAPTATPSPEPAQTATPEPAAPVESKGIWSMRAAVDAFEACLDSLVSAAPAPMRDELWKALAERFGQRCGVPMPAKGKPPVSVERSIYDAYPRKVAPKAALKAIAAALKACANEEPSAAAYLLDRTVKFAQAVSKWPARDQKFIPHPATWFNRGSYADDPKEWQRGTATAPEKPTDYSRI